MRQVLYRCKFFNTNWILWNEELNFRTITCIEKLIHTLNWKIKGGKVHNKLARKFRCTWFEYSCENDECNRVKSESEHRWRHDEIRLDESRANNLRSDIDPERARTRTMQTMTIYRVSKMQNKRQLNKLELDWNTLLQKMAKMTST